MTDKVFKARVIDVFKNCPLMKVGDQTVTSCHPVYTDNGGIILELRTWRSMDYIITKDRPSVEWEFKNGVAEFEAEDGRKHTITAYNLVPYEPA